MLICSLRPLQSMVVENISSLPTTTSFNLTSFLHLSQSMVAEKDAELAHTYKLLEASASERSRLRTEHQAAQERMRELQVCVC